VHVRITPNDSTQVTFSVVEGLWIDDGTNDGAVPGSCVPAVYRDAVFAGAKAAYDGARIETGIAFVLIDALVHPVDARETKFKEAGWTALRGWLELNLGIAPLPS